MPDGLVDAHHHVWDLTRHRQDWLDEAGHESIRRSFPLDDLRAAATRPIRGRTLTTTVVVQSIASVPETLDLLALAARELLVGAVVGWVDLRSPAVADQLDELRAAPGGEHLRSLRHLVQGETDPDWLRQSAVERGLRAVAARGLGYDLLIRAHQFDQALGVAGGLPGLPLVLDHAGKPPIAGGDLADWERQIRRLARHEQVRCKVSGLITEAAPARWSLTDIRPVWDVLLDAFGPRRLMFGSDWPVCLLAGGWDRWADAVDRLLSAFSADETEAVLAGTARDFYQLPSVPKEPITR